jgi:hypothetical protein
VTFNPSDVVTVDFPGVSTESGIDSCRLMLFAYPIAKLLMFQLCCQNPIASHVLTKNHLPISPPAYC